MTHNTFAEFAVIVLLALGAAICIFMPFFVIGMAIHERITGMR